MHLWTCCSHNCSSLSRFLLGCFWLLGWGWWNICRLGCGLGFTWGCCVNKMSVRLQFNYSSWKALRRQRILSMIFNRLFISSVITNQHHQLRLTLSAFIITQLGWITSLYVCIISLYYHSSGDNTNLVTAYIITHPVCWSHKPQPCAWCLSHGPCHDPLWGGGSPGQWHNQLPSEHLLVPSMAHKCTSLGTSSTLASISCKSMCLHRNHSEIRDNTITVSIGDMNSDPLNYTHK